MLQRLSRAARNSGIDTRRLYHAISAASIRAAMREQDLVGLSRRLEAVVPDLQDQYTAPVDAIEYARYWELKLRGLHAWQVRCVHRALAAIGRQDLILADIGDSVGNHSRYIMATANPGQVKRVISVNLDPVAVEKVRQNGGDAILSRAASRRWST